MSHPPVLIMHATGTNRDREAALACELAGGAPEIVHINELMAGSKHLRDYRMLVLPGGFSFGDDLGAGKLWAVLLRFRLADELNAFITAGKPVLGICNGFQVLVKSLLLPGPGSVSGIDDGRQPVTLTRNDSARFECRWVHLMPQPGSRCIFTDGLAEPIACPVAHGEGKFLARDFAATLQAMEAADLVALRYSNPQGTAAHYPWNPNGSQGDIAGICNSAGNVLGLMPHPEDHIFPEQHPQYHRGRRGQSGLPLFENGIRYAAGL